MSCSVLKGLLHTDLDDIKQRSVTQRLGSRPMPLFLQRYLLVIDAERAFKGSQEGISPALLIFVGDREPFDRIQNSGRPLDQGMLASSVEEKIIMEETERDTAVHLHCSPQGAVHTRREGPRLPMRSSPANQWHQRYCDQSATQEGTSWSPSSSEMTSDLPAGRNDAADREAVPGGSETPYTVACGREPYASGGCRASEVRLGPRENRDEGNRVLTVGPNAVVQPFVSGRCRSRSARAPGWPLVAISTSIPWGKVVDALGGGDLGPSKRRELRLAHHDSPVFQ